VNSKTREKKQDKGARFQARHTTVMNPVENALIKRDHTVMQAVNDISGDKDEKKPGCGHRYREYKAPEQNTRYGAQQSVVFRGQHGYYLHGKRHPKGTGPSRTPMERPVTCIYIPHNPLFALIRLKLPDQFS
jgi:hypothetical protein